MDADEQLREDLRRARFSRDQYQAAVRKVWDDIEAISRMVCRSSLPIEQQQPILAAIGQAQTVFRDGAHREAFAETDRLRAITRDLAAKDPTDDRGDCMLCGALDHLRPEGHAESCPWRRAVEATR